MRPARPTRSRPRSVPSWRAACPPCPPPPLRKATTMPHERAPDDVEPGDLAEVPRPRESTRFVGHRAAEAAFAAPIGSGRLHHAWLIGGPQGIGKATLAYRVARWLLAHPDRQEAPDHLQVAPEHP